MAIFGSIPVEPAHAQDIFTAHPFRSSNARRDDALEEYIALRHPADGELAHTDTKIYAPARSCERQRDRSLRQHLH